jgi:hypothetical protein
MCRVRIKHKTSHCDLNFLTISYSLKLIAVVVVETLQKYIGGTYDVLKSRHGMLMSGLQLCAKHLDIILCD